MRIVAILHLLALLCLADGPGFDVASIKVSEAPTNGMSGYIGIREGGSISLRNVTLHFLVGMAYALPDYRISGGPGWIDTLRYHVDAKPAAPVSQEVARQMMQTLLADRFQLQVHHENKIVDGFILTAPKADSKMQKLAPEAPIGFRFMQPGRIQGPGNIKMLLNSLKAILGVPVEDGTGLTAAYDIDLEWGLNETTDDGKPSLFAALGERLGLVLQHERVSVDVLVIDRAGKPTAN